MIIEGAAIYKQYDQLTVLKGVDIQVSAGEVVTIVGKSGAGKSTLLHILGTLDRPTSGTVRILGHDVTALSARDLARFRNKHIGFVFQFHHLLAEFSAEENVCIPAWIAREQPDKAIRERARYLLDYLGLAERLHHRPAQLSGGEQQRVAVARAMMNQPAVIFADEPSGNLDTASSQDLHRLFFDLRRDLGQTFVIVTHNTELAALSDRTLTMRDGLIV